MKRSLPVAFYLILVSSSLFAQMPSGAVADYPMDNTATDISGNGYNGTLTSTTATANRFGNSAKATAFTGGVSTGTLPLGLVTAMQNNFSIGFWFKTNMTANSSTQWYGGNAMVDAEVCGGTSDWGTALVNGGKVCFGIGNPDLTIISPSNYNDNNWHFVTGVRNATAGSITLYVDGSQVASTAGTSTAALTAPGFIGLGRNFCSSSAMYTGSLDDIVSFNRVLTSTEVLNMYNFMSSFVLPLKWVSFTGETNSAGIQLNWQVEQLLNVNRFEVEHSIDGAHFFSIATIATNKGIQAGSTLSYEFLHPSPGNGSHYYRIRQVDNDGRSSYSTIIKVSTQHSSVQPYSLSNPIGSEMLLINRQQRSIRELVMMDPSGKIVKRWRLNSNETTIKIPVDNLLPGYYILRVVEMDGNIVSLPCIRS